MPDTIHLCQAFFSQINPNLSASREEWKLVYISEAQP